MPHAPNVREYIEQLIKVAGKGNITVDFALHVDRMQLHCKSCDISMTSHTPERSDKIDYSIQNFITIHGHTGGHNDTKLVKTGLGKVTAVTLDFKKVNGEWGDLGEISGQHRIAPIPFVKKDKPLKIATGRKFR